jgi:hypothetical protein
MEDLWKIQFFFKVNPKLYPLSSYYIQEKHKIMKNFGIQSYLFVTQQKK